MNIPKKTPPCKTCLVQAACNRPCHNLYIYHCKRLKKLRRMNGMVPGVASMLCPLVYLISYLFNLTHQNILFVTVIGIGTFGFTGILLQGMFFTPRIIVSEYVVNLWEFWK